MLVNCVICSDLFGAADEVSITPCGHLFHFICVTHWLSRAKTCPQCRAKTTDQTIRRVYFNISNNQNEEEEAGSLQNKLDTLSFDVRLKGVEIKKLEETNDTLKNQTQGLKVEIKKLEEKLSTQVATTAALKQQVQFFQAESKDAIKSKNECKRLRIQLENLQNVDTIVHGTVDEVDQLLQNYTVSSDSIRSLATFVSVLKKEMKTLTDKRKELRDSLRSLDIELRSANTKNDQLSSQLSTLKLTNKQLEEDLKHLENTKRSMQKKIEKLEEAIMSPTEETMADSDEIGLSNNDELDAVDGLENGQDVDITEGEEGDGDVATNGASGVDDPELEAIKARVREMEEEAEKLKQLQTEVDKQMNLGSPPGINSQLNMSIEEKMEVDNRSIYVGSVDYGATAEELEQHFHGCGSINRVTILCNKFDGHPKGFAYIEFADRDSVQTAMAMDESLFRGRQIKVMPKRTNRPGMSMTNRPPRGRGGFRGSRGMPRGSFYGGGFRPARRARGGYRGRAAYYMPY